LVRDAGQITIQTATLVERSEPYHLQLELARGKINQLRNQAADWLMGGLVMPPALEKDIRDTTHFFTCAITQQEPDQHNAEAESALAFACATADELVQVYINQVFQIRQARQPRLDTLLGCRLGSSVPDGEAAAALTAAANMVMVPYSIHQVAPDEGDYHWDEQDALLDWSLQNNLTAWGGPLVDFSNAHIPPWLSLWQGDRGRIAKLLCEYTADVLERCHGHIDTWQLTAAANLPGTLSLQEDELVWLTLQMGETAHRVAPNARLIVGIAQPWGEYLREKERRYSPFIFADTLLRTGLPLAAFDLEIVMGVAARGSYCRDLLELSRLLDMYSLLGVPLHVTLGYPAHRTHDSQADPSFETAAGYWRRDFDPQVQAEWAAKFAALALCKPQVRSVQWAHFSDADSHQFPNCGLVDGQGKPRPAMDTLLALRKNHLH
jgi:hypothetical protein